MSRIVLATIGTLGDLHPFIALGLELQQRGHSVVIASHGGYGDRVTPLGLEFKAMRPDDSRMKDPVEMAKVMDINSGTERVMTDLAAEVRDSYEDLLAIAHNADLIIAGEVVFAAPIVAEVLGIPWSRVALSPISFMSTHDFPLLPNVPWTYGIGQLGPAGGGLLKELVKLISYPWMKPVHQLRKELGLSFKPFPMFNDKFSERLTLALFSPCLAQSQPDWPKNTAQSSFVFYDGAETALSPELDAFLQVGEAPIIFTLGSAAVMLPGRFYDESIAAAKQLGKRAVLLIGRNHPPAGLTEDIIAVDYAPYSQVFSRACAVVHQGGIGTTAQGLRAGVPTVVIPYSHDQPDNAKRLEQLGTSLTIGRDRYNTARAVKTLNQLLHQPIYQQRAAQVGEQIRQEKGVEGACEAIAALLKQRVTIKL